MILPLRRAHRSVFAALALFLPALLASAWKVRPEPVTQALPPELLPGLPGPPTSPGADELVYWTAAATEGDWSELPADAELVGTVRSGALERVPPSGMKVLCYDLPHQRLRRWGGAAEKAP